MPFARKSNRQGILGGLHPLFIAVTVMLTLFNPGNEQKNDYTHIYFRITWLFVPYLVVFSNSPTGEKTIFSELFVYNFIFNIWKTFPATFDIIHRTLSPYVDCAVWLLVPVSRTLVSDVERLLSDRSCLSSQHTHNRCLRPCLPFFRITTKNMNKANPMSELRMAKMYWKVVVRTSTARKPNNHVPPRRMLRGTMVRVWRMIPSTRVSWRVMLLLIRWQTRRRNSKPNTNMLKRRSAPTGSKTPK